MFDAFVGPPLPTSGILIHYGWFPGVPSPHSFLTLPNFAVPSGPVTRFLTPASFWTFSA